MAGLAGRSRVRFIRPGVTFRDLEAHAAAIVPVEPGHVIGEARQLTVARCGPCASAANDELRGFVLVNRADEREPGSVGHPSQPQPFPEPLRHVSARVALRPRRDPGVGPAAARFEAIRLAAHKSNARPAPAFPRVNGHGRRQVRLLPSDGSRGRCAADTSRTGEIRQTPIGPDRCRQQGRGAEPKSFVGSHGRWPARSCGRNSLFSRSGGAVVSRVDLESSFHASARDQRHDEGVTPCACASKLMQTGA